ncbi:MAG: TonB-dependent siderophore receptor [Sphingomonas sp.]|uniref:TonB-dependent receptor n=1 Tax=Sphingomonas sp. TaxID=28214 RepID=UPI0025CC6767|nr:TonB-dependent siderophore receptor [Sphingomonas sp.]MBY0285180.1 TonB-dependent siderophore receptor [Sphingomonas sp.]
MRPEILCLLAATSALGLLPAPALAGPTTAPAPADPEGDRVDVTVTGQRSGYATAETSTATRTPTPIKDVPQAITSIERQQIDDQAFRSISDALRYVPGAIAAQGEGNRDQIVLRGNNSTADFFVDGQRDDVQYYRPLYNLDRLEILRGPNALTFGRGGGGGVINRVTKTPTLATFGGASASVDSFGAWYVDGDLNYRLSDSVAVRANAVREEFANHRQVYGGHVTAVNPVVKWFAGPDTAFTLSYEYVDDDRVTDRGIPSLGGRPLTGFRDTFFGVAGINRTQFTGNVARATVEHRFSDALSITGRLLYGDYDKYYSNAFPSGSVTAAGLVPVQAYRDFTFRENLLSQTDLVWRTRTGAIEHVILAGAEFGRQDTRSSRLNGFFDGVAGATDNGLTFAAPLADPFVVPPIVFRTGSGQRDNVSTATIFAGYVQDQLKIGPVELLLGVRHDRFRLDVTDQVAGQQFSRSDALWSPRAGLVVHPIKPVSLYFSYARSYLPQSGDQFTSLNVTTAALKPEQFDNYEVGAKWEPRAGLLIAANVYQLDRTNTRAVSPVDGRTTVLTGAQRSRGIEIEARGAITPDWQLSFGYSYQDARITETTLAARAGSKVALVPEHSVSAFTRYNVTKRFGIGAGVSYFSDRFASISNSVTLPGYARVDAALYYKLTKAIEVQVNVENLFDAGYFPTAHTDNNISTGAPLNGRATIRFRF